MIQLRTLAGLLPAFLLLGASATAQEGTRLPAPTAPHHSITDDELAQLPSPEKLEIVILRGRMGYGIDLVTDTGITHLVRCRRLRVLHAGGLSLTDRSLEWIGKLDALEELHLDSNRITGEGLRHLVGLKRLRRLNLSLNPLRPEVYATLAKLTGLTHLSVYSGAAADDRALEQCARLTNLEELLADNTAAVTDRGLGHLLRLKKLKNLALRDAEGITDAGLARLAELTRLEELSLYNLRSVTPRGLDVLAKLPQLRRLEIATVPMDERSVRALASLEKLETLLLWNVGRATFQKGRPLPLEVLGELRLLRSFRTNQKMSSAAIRALGRLKGLESIRDELTEITDEDLKYLAQLPKLRELALGSEHITAASLPTLAGMTSLRELYVTDKVRVSPDQWRLLGESSLTRCRISQWWAPYTAYYQPAWPAE
jgi:Leucine-rich repeat (LRR) protein